MPKLIEEIYGIIRAARFWEVVFASVVIYLGTTEVISLELAQAIAGGLGVSVGIGTVDRFAKNIKK